MRRTAPPIEARPPLLSHPADAPRAGCASRGKARHTERVKWLDDNIDRMRARTRFNSGRGFTSFSRGGSIWNVVICGIIAVGAIAGGVLGTPFAFLVGALAVAMEVQFARIAYRAFRGDFAAPAASAT